MFSAQFLCSQVLSCELKTQQWKYVLRLGFWLRSLPILFLSIFNALSAEFVLIQKPQRVSQNIIVRNLVRKCIFQCWICRLVFCFSLHRQVPFTPSMNVIVDLQLCDIFCILCPFHKLAEQMVQQILWDFVLVVLLLSQKTLLSHIDKLLNNVFALRVHLLSLSHLVIFNELVLS